jgi:ribosomal protein S24E
MEIKQDKRNDLLNRQEVIADLEAEKNPGFDEARKKLAEHFSKPEENIDVYGLKGSFGKNVFRINAFIYDSKKDLDRMKALRMTRKERGEIKKAAEEAKKRKEEVPIEERAEQTEEKPAEEPTGANLEDRAEEEKKAKREEEQKEEEAREP